MPAVAPRVAPSHMTLYDLVTELRNTPSPKTRKPHHTLTEIAQIAGASNGWTAYVLAGGPDRKPNAASERYHAPLRRYLRKLHQGLVPTSEEESEAPVADATPTREESPRKRRRRLRIEATASVNGSNASTQEEAAPLEPQEQEAAAATSEVSFAALYHEFQNRLWVETSNLDALIASDELRALQAHCPPLFAPALKQFRGDLEVVRDHFLSLVARLDGSGAAQD